MNSNQTKTLYSNLDDIIKGNKDNKKIVLFGCNLPAYKTILYLTSKNINVSYIVDNVKYGARCLGINIYKPEDVLEDFDDDFLILIASRYYDEMVAQLNQMGYIENKHIFSTVRFEKSSLSNKKMDSNIQCLKNGYNIFNDLKKKYGEEAFIFMFPYCGLGDIYFIGSYLKTYIIKNNIDKYIITVIGNACRRLIDLFQLKNVVVLTQDESDDLLTYAKVTGFSNTKIKCLTHNLVHTDIVEFFENVGNIKWGNIIKNITLDLNKNDRYVLPIGKFNNKERVIKYFNENSLKVGRTVIISPYANTLVGIDNRKWKIIVDRLNRLGYTVCTNSSDKEREPVLDNTKGVFFPLCDANCFIETAGYFIGVRSGFCDVISNAKAKKVIIYPTKESCFFSIKHIGFGDKNIEEVIYYDDIKFAKEVLKKLSIEWRY